MRRVLGLFDASNHNRPVAREGESYEVRPFPKIRRAYVDVLREGHRRHIIHGLVEVDISKAKDLIASVEGERVSFTGFITSCVGTAVDDDRMLHAHRWGDGNWSCSMTSTSTCNWSRSRLTVRGLCNRGSSGR